MMKTVHEVSRLAGVSVRTLHHYDAIGLLKPAQLTEAGYRLYDDAALRKLQSILLLRQLRFSLGEIKSLLSSPNFDAREALRDQIRLLELQRAQLDGLIVFARNLLEHGGEPMDFSAFDTTNYDACAAEAKARWGDTAAFRAYEEKTAARSAAEQAAAAERLMAVFADFGKIKTLAPASNEAQAQVAALQRCISEYYYPCTTEILTGLGQMYVGDARFAANIDRAGGEGTAAFAAAAIAQYCKA